MSESTIFNKTKADLIGEYGERLKIAEKEKNAAAISCFFEWISNLNQVESWHDFVKLKIIDKECAAKFYADILEKLRKGEE